MPRYLRGRPSRPASRHMPWVLAHVHCRVFWHCAWTLTRNCSQSVWGPAGLRAATLPRSGGGGGSSGGPPASPSFADWPQAALLRARRAGAMGSPGHRRDFLFWPGKSDDELVCKPGPNLTSKHNGSLYRIPKEGAHFNSPGSFHRLHKRRSSPCQGIANATKAELGGNV